MGCQDGLKWKAQGEWEGSGGQNQQTGVGVEEQDMGRKETRRL